jgi:hypothetical protein
MSHYLEEKRQGRRIQGDCLEAAKVDLRWRTSMSRKSCSTFSVPTGSVSMNSSKSLRRRRLSRNLRLT